MQFQRIIIRLEKVYSETNEWDTQSDTEIEHISEHTMLPVT